jgi:hypothetical protein
MIRYSASAVNRGTPPLKYSECVICGVTGSIQGTRWATNQDAYRLRKKQYNWTSVIIVFCAINPHCTLANLGMTKVLVGAMARPFLDIGETGISICKYSKWPSSRPSFWCSYIKKVPMMICKGRVGVVSLDGCFFPLNRAYLQMPQSSKKMELIWHIPSLLVFATFSRYAL